MKYKCTNCKITKELHKVRLSYINYKLVCKEAYCCEQYMEQLITDEYKGMPDIKRNEEIHSKPSGEQLWKQAKDDLLSGEGIDKHAKNRTTK